MSCPDCPDLPNATVKRATCCRRSGELKVGDRVPMPEKKLDIRPAFTGPGKIGFKPARKHKR